MTLYIHARRCNTHLPGKGWTVPQYQQPHYCWHLWVKSRELEDATSPVYYYKLTFNLLILKTYMYLIKLFFIIVDKTYNVLNKVIIFELRLFNKKLFLLISVIFAFFIMYYLLICIMLIKWHTFVFFTQYRNGCLFFIF